MKITPYLAAALLTTTAFAAPAFAKTVKAPEFVKMASIGGNYEIESSKLALKKSQNAEVKELAQMLIDDHMKAGEELKTTASNEGVNTAKKGLDPKHQAMVDRLKTTNGKNFDHVYLDQQKAAHKETIDLFDDYADDGDNAALKEFAANTLPTLKAHKDHIEDVK